mmetsp:Transcript_50585/g.82758  ORF Transcript_50585/g.82758 Transcript_50585/m.82758 type:complete len:619 (+) Transcript_50585:45-1901(+)
MVAMGSLSHRWSRRVPSQHRRALQRSVHVLSYRMSSLLRHKLRGKVTSCSKRSGLLRQQCGRRISCKPLHPLSASMQVVVTHDAPVESTESYFHDSGSSLLGADCGGLQLFGAEADGDSMGTSSESTGLVRQGSISFLGDQDSKPAEPAHEDACLTRTWTDDSEILQSSLLSFHGRRSGSSEGSSSLGLPFSCSAAPTRSSTEHDEELLGDDEEESCSSSSSDLSEVGSGSDTDEPQEHMTLSEYQLMVQYMMDSNPDRVYGLSNFRGAPTIQRRPAVLSSFDLPGVVKYIKDKPACKILVLTGAGISVAAGIPDFRSPGTGLYSRLREYDLPEPSAIFDLDYFPYHPEPFYTLAKELWPGNYAPTVVHHFITMLQEKGLLLRNYTQNIDGLELVAGMPREALVEVHGTFATARCLGCNQAHSSAHVKQAVFEDRIPRCRCGDLIKPDIVFFGEQLPERFFDMVKEDLDEAELVIVLGTSLQVAPFASLPDQCQDDVPRLLINNEVVGQVSPYRPSGFDFGENNYRDVKLIGDCQQGVLQLAEMLGWKDELEARHEAARKLAPPAPLPAQFPRPEWLIRRQAVDQLNDVSEESDASLGSGGSSELPYAPPTKGEAGPI